ncbi:MAG: acetylornithine deacetylase [Geminicoccaceae bacterium]
MPSNPSCQELLKRLVAFDTTSRNSNLDLIEFVRDLLDHHSVASELIANEEGTKANLFASIGPVDRPGLVLSGHTDVVPVDGQNWSSDPFALTTRDERLFGRGASDMKGFIAAVLALLPEIRAVTLERPVHLAFSYDEEVGCKGVPHLLDRLVDVLPVLPKACVVGEPTGMKIANGHKGKAGYRCTVIGRASHSALNHKGVNAVEIAALIVARLREMNLDFRANGPFLDGFEPPHCTVTTGVMAGGTALNIVPSSCYFEFEFRLLPGQDANAMLAKVEEFACETLLPSMKSIAPEATIEWCELMSYPALGSNQPSEIERLGSALTSTEQPQKLSFGTEAGHFAKRGIPSIVCGPGHIDVAHKPDEYVEISQLNDCTSFLRNLVRQVTSV